MLSRFKAAVAILVVSANAAAAQNAPATVALRFNIFDLAPRGELSQDDVNQFKRSVDDVVRADSLVRVDQSANARYRLDASIARRDGTYAFRLVITDLMTFREIVRDSARAVRSEDLPGVVRERTRGVFQSLLR